ncbi:hypothetical protein FRB99_003715 [Tulasnella sp. 403]|nr:hypothetical protein FRB99_003715 [Tulasnella sp. 403]
MNALDPAEERFEDSIDHCTTALRMRRNTSPAIFTLPVELLGEIFLKCFEGDECEDSRLRRLNILELVCTYWETVVRQTPRLWAVVRHDEDVDLMLERSGTAPIHVSFYGSTENAERFLHLVGPHSDRWASLSFSCVSADVIAPYLETPRPLLRNLYLRVQSGSVQLPDGYRLNEVTLVGPVGWDWAIISSLTSLTLGDVSVGGNELFSAIRACPDLEVLCLRDLHESEGPSYSSTPHLPLPRLKSLILRSIPTSIARVLLSIVRSQALTTVRLSDFRTDAAQVLSAIASSNPSEGDEDSLLALILRCETLEICHMLVNQHEFTLQGWYRRGGDLQLTLGSSDWVDELLQASSFFEAFRDSHVKVELVLRVRHLTSERLAFVDMIPNLWSVKVYDRVDPRAVLEYLESRILGDGDCATQALPHLRRLVFMKEALWLDKSMRDVLTALVMERMHGRQLPVLRIFDCFSRMFDTESGAFVW